MTIEELSEKIGKFKPYLAMPDTPKEKLEAMLVSHLTGKLALGYLFGDVLLAVVIFLEPRENYECVIHIVCENLGILEADHPEDAEGLLAALERAKAWGSGEVPLPAPIRTFDEQYAYMATEEFARLYN